jgi:hypothetical protein
MYFHHIHPPTPFSLSDVFSSRVYCLFFELLLIQMNFRRVRFHEKSYWIGKVQSYLVYKSVGVNYAVAVRTLFLPLMWCAFSYLSFFDVSWLSFVIFFIDALHLLARGEPQVRKLCSSQFSMHSSMSSSQVYTHICFLLSPCWFYCPLVPSPPTIWGIFNVFIVLCSIHCYFLCTYLNLWKRCNVVHCFSSFAPSPRLLGFRLCAYVASSAWLLTTALLSCACTTFYLSNHSMEYRLLPTPCHCK